MFDRKKMTKNCCLSKNVHNFLKNCLQAMLACLRLFPCLHLAAVNIFVMILKCIDILDKTIRRLLLPSFLTCRHLSTCSLAAFPIQLSCECLCNLKWSCLWERIHSIAKWRSVKKYSIFYELKSLCRDDSIPVSPLAMQWSCMINIYPILHLTIRYSIQEFISLASRGKEAVGAPSTGMNIGFSLRSGIMNKIFNIFSYVHTPRCWYQQCKKLFVCFNVKLHGKFRILI